MRQHIDETFRVSDYDIFHLTLGLGCLLVNLDSFANNFGQRQNWVVFNDGSMLVSTTAGFNARGEYNCS